MRRGGINCTTTRNLEINSNINKLSIKDKTLLKHYFVDCLSKNTLKFIHKLGYKEVQRRLCTIIRDLAK